LLNSLGEWLEKQAALVLPKSPLGEAVGYARNQWAALQVYTTAGYLESTRPANCILDKRSMREVRHRDCAADRARRAKGNSPLIHGISQADLVVEVLLDWLPSCGGLGRSRLTSTQPLVRQPREQLLVRWLLTQREQRRQ
jgi:hypothetical protein